MAHSQKSIRDHARRRNQPHIDNQVIAQQLEDLVKPCVYSQLNYYRSLGMRERILSLPLMVAAVLTLLWRQVPSVGELNRMLAREDLLWARKVEVSQQALSQRFLSFPAELFERVLKELLVPLNQRWQDWLFYVVLIDLADEVADELALPTERISVEMVFRGLYHFAIAYNQGKATDPVAYLTAPENRDLGVVKALRPQRSKPPLDLSPFPQPQGLTQGAFA